VAGDADIAEREPAAFDSDQARRDRRSSGGAAQPAENYPRRNPDRASTGDKVCTTCGKEFLG